MSKIVLKYWSWSHWPTYDGDMPLRSDLRRRNLLRTWTCRWRGWDTRLWGKPGTARLCGPPRPWPTPFVPEEGSADGFRVLEGGIRGRGWDPDDVEGLGGRVLLCRKSLVQLPFPVSGNGDLELENSWAKSDWGKWRKSFGWGLATEFYPNSMNSSIQILWIVLSTELSKFYS